MNPGTRWPYLALVVLVLLLGALACNMGEPLGGISHETGFPAAATETPTMMGLISSDPDEGQNGQATLQPLSVIVDYIPTPDPIREHPAIRTEPVSHVVAYGDSLQTIATTYAVGVNTIQQANGISNPNVIYRGQVLIIPAQQPEPAGSEYKIIPNSELVFSPACIGFDPVHFADQYGGYLGEYEEEIDGAVRSGAEIVERVSWQYSVNPRLLLALLEYHSGWVFSSSGVDKGPYPFGFITPGYEGLYRQLSWAADLLNQGYYRFRAGWNGPYIFSSGDTAYIAQGLNAGTVAVQHLMTQLYEPDAWREAIAAEGFYRTYYAMFGSPYIWQVDPLLPADLAQPALQLPFEPGRMWYFTGGPHSAWGNHAAWGAIDFAPPGEGRGCIPSYDWVTAAADGVIVRSEEGIVLQDLDGDGDDRTGWVLLYLHIASYDRVQAGAVVRAGDRIGHPSCEGGISTGTHIHFARKYNGEWISADADLPINLDGWISSGAGVPYNGWLSRESRSIEAYWKDSPENIIYR